MTMLIRWTPSEIIRRRLKLTKLYVDQVTDEVDDLDLGLKKKKKKAKDADEDGEGVSTVRASTGSFAAPTELGPNDIYPYAQILQRIYDALSEKNPELMGGKKFTMIPPQVCRI
jgi:hypothetical protein